MALIATRPQPNEVIAKPSRARRAVDLLDEAERRGAALDAARAMLPEARCRNCRRVLFKYRPPITYVLQPCRRCGSWNEITAT